ncbi:Cfr10I/Bse634I family restriction endonuclease [Spirosoma fluviale]|uniref:Cfr10I/Bse634I restriction endonuclease n=1 Tax=Spirosoma fluviale TaxID=1597977 RepID=A0A286G882_9BACT|nr:Cfr10I/Bse634I family restriction endonuclease [Spirosoma fluviale]SOD91682.1 Cfr10I/Bse634I restriction endonuclease [Spirosoma fluviale]
MNFIRILKDGKSQVIKDEAFFTLLNNTLPNIDKSIRELISEFDTEVSKIDKTVTKDALNNVHGDWYEWLLAIEAWNYCADHEKANLAILTPNISQFDVAKLYNNRLFSLIQDLREKVLISSSVQLISSNPDFVIIDRKLVNKIFPKIERINFIDKSSLTVIENAFRHFINQCDFEDIFGYISVKTSFRPDRRLQIPHEGSLMKAIYTHLQTREWIINPKGLMYFAIATKVGTPDRAALKTVATHSITTVHSIPQAAVDEVYEVNSLRQAQEAFAQILHASPKSVS